MTIRQLSWLALLSAFAAGPILIPSSSGPHFTNYTPALPLLMPISRGVFAGRRLLWYGTSPLVLQDRMLELDLATETSLNH
jgi:hypothetical protein